MPGSKKRRTVATSDELASSMGPKDAVDFYVPIAEWTTCRTLSVFQTTTAVLHNLKKSGYVKCALTHTVYGRPKNPDDLANNAIPAVLYANSPIPVLRRLHVVVETLADLGLFAAQSPIANLLKTYDIISLSPRNAATLDGACNAQVDIVTMEYHSMQSVPFRWRRHHIRQLAQNQIRFEIPYAPALTDAKARRNLMTLCNDAVAAAPNLLISSGPRIVQDNDMGPQILRRPGDMLNFAHVVMGVSAHSLHNAMRGNLPRWKTGNKMAVKVTNVRIVPVDDSINSAVHETKDISTVKMGTANDTTTSTSKERNADEEEQDDGDGFIAL